MRPPASERRRRLVAAVVALNAVLRAEQVTRARFLRVPEELVSRGGPALALYRAWLQADAAQLPALRRLEALTRAAEMRP